MRLRVLLVTLGFWLTAADSSADTAQVLERLRINHAAMVHSERDFHERQRLGTLNGVEASDYAAYVARLHRLVAEDCAQLMRAGVVLPQELGCPMIMPALPVPAAIDQATERTLDEQLAVLDAELLGGMGEFDEMLLREQDRVRAQTPMGGAAGGSGTGSAGGGQGQGEDGADQAGGGEGAGETGGESGGQSASAAGSSGADSAGARTTAGRGDAGGGMGGRESGQRASHDGRRGGVPRDIPDGDDDDVVARQLREAAEKETSPELKAKLWEEYRRYKEGLR